MKHFKISKIVLLIIVTLTIFSCETDFDNPNAATSDETFSTREGILAAAVGMQQLYSKSGIRWIVETPAITTREVGITTTFQNMIELEDGGTNLPNFNSNVEGFWFTMMRIIKVAEDIEKNVDNIDLEAGTRSGLLAHSKLFKALSIGALSQSYQQVITATSSENKAEFVSREAGFDASINILNEAKSIIISTAVSKEFIDQVTLGNINLLNTINAYLARYNLFTGNYEAAITAANAVNLNSKSEFVYDSQNLNPIWSRVYQNDSPNFKPRDNFGLPAEFTFDPNDGRVAFYLIPLDETNQNGLPIEDLVGFFNENVESIPIYIPDEMNLIIAEANLRKSSPNIPAAEAALNEVLTDTDDPYGINANLPPYSGPLTVDAMLDEVYRNRRAELFLTGMSLEDSRRFGRPQPSGTSQKYDEERNRNFYPFPNRERNNNPNTPNDPNI